MTESHIPGLTIRPQPHECQPPDMRRPTEIEVTVGALWWKRVEIRTVLRADFIIGVEFDCPVCRSHWHWDPPYVAADSESPGDWYRHDYYPEP